MASALIGAGAVGAVGASGGPALSSAARPASHRVTLDSATGVQITNYYSGLCLDAEDDSSSNPSDNGDKVQLWDCTGASNQHWIISAGALTQAYGTIVNANSGKCLDAEDDANGNPGDNGDKVQLWTCNGGQNQQWDIDAIAGEGNLIVNAFGLVLDAEQDAKGNPDENGDKVQLWQGTGGLNQEWDY